MRKGAKRTLRCLSRWGVLTALGVGITIGFCPPVLSQPKKRQQWNLRGGQTFSPQEEGDLNRKLERWKSLPPERQRVLRDRMEEWKQLSPEERELYRKRYHQWQGLSPDERQSIREKLEQWNSLPPRDREEIRRRFRNP
jgi:hypothetical protein